MTFCQHEQATRANQSINHEYSAAQVLKILLVHVRRVEMSNQPKTNAAYRVAQKVSRCQLPINRIKTVNGDAIGIMISGCVFVFTQTTVSIHTAHQT